MINMSLENLKPGISAIIPTCKGEDYIENLLNSLKNQTIDYNLFEAIFIVNGELDSTPQIIENFQKENPEIDIILANSEVGVCPARNVGIEIASRQYTIFIDDDDFISPKYFEKLLEHAKPGRIVIGTFMNKNEFTGEIEEFYLTPPLLKKSGIIEDAYNYMPDILVITTDKLIPTVNVKNSTFNPNLKNGVDIGYYSIFYAENDFEFFVVNKDEEAIYYKCDRFNSISRKPLSYDFNISDRLKVINDINKGIKLAKTPERKSFIESLTAGQINRINEYLKEYPEDLKKVMDDINSYNYDFFPYKYFNEDMGLLNKSNNELIISYAFPPTNTAASNVIAKKILTEKNNVSVICAKLDNLDKDYSFENLVNQFIIDKMVIDLPFDISLENMRQFTDLGMVELNKRPTYDKIYSIAHFTPSHLLAYYYKLTHDTFWSAEFSDPLIYNMNGDYQSLPIEDEDLVNKINKTIPDEFDKIKSTDTLNFILEYITYIFADELVFTNKNQKDVMIENFPKLKDIINKKAKIVPAQVLDEKYYYIKESQYTIDKNYINFAYFGAIFGNRNFESFINGFDNLAEEYKDKYRLHLFTSNKIMFEQILNSDILTKTTINPNIEFLEFLNLTKKFDVLLVEDSTVKELYVKNPFLPSKLSDYLGSGSDIWAICDDGSIMDKMDLKYKSKLNNTQSIVDTINQIMSDKLNKQSKLKELDLEDYLKNRNTHLSKKIEELILVAQEEFQKDENYESKIKNLEDENNKLKKELQEGILKKLLKKIKN